MPKATKTILMNGGLVTSRDPSMLNEGELQLANGAEYHPGSQSIYKVKGRSKFNTAEAEAGYPVKGLYYAQYDDAADKLIAYANATYYEATAADTGTFSTGQASVGSGTTLKGCHYIDRHYLFNGTGSYNYMRKSSGTYRRTGLTAPSATMTAVARTEAANETIRPTSNTAGATGYTSPTLAYDSDLTTYAYHASSAASTAISTFHTFTGATSKRWFLLIKHEGIMSAQQYDNSGTHKLEYSINNGSTWTEIGIYDFPYAVRNESIDLGASYNPAGVGTELKIRATTTIDGGVGILRGKIYDIRIEFGGSSSAFTGALTYWYTEIDSSENLESASSATVLCSATAANYIELTLGTKINSGTDYFRIYRTVATGLWPNGGLLVQIPATQTTYFDAQDDVDTLNTPAYNYITVSDISYSRDSEPPLSKQGELFQGSICLTSVNNPRYVFYSYPGYPESFPSIYYVDFDTNKNDTIVVIKRSGNLLGVFMNEQTWRLYRLPIASDSVFDSSIVKEIANSDIGCVSINGVDSFSIGGDQRLAFVARNGIWMTNLFQFEPLTDDIDWDATVNKAQLANSILINYPKKYQMRFYYASSGSSTNDKCLIFHYHPSHLKEGGRMKISGPVDANIASATLGVVSGEYKLWLGDSAAQAFAYLEDNGTDDDSNSYDTSGNIDFDIKTADQYFGGIAGEFTTEEAYLHHAAHSGVDVTLTTNCLYDPRSTNRSWSLDKTIDLTRQGADNVFINRNAHRVNFEIKNQVKDEDVTLNHLTLQVTSLGDLEE